MAAQHSLITADSPGLHRYTIEQGHVGIVKRFGKAIRQVGPGIHLKIPFVDGVEEIEVRCGPRAAPFLLSLVIQEATSYADKKDPGSVRFLSAF